MTVLGLIGVIGLYITMDYVEMKERNKGQEK